MGSKRFHTIDTARGFLLLHMIVFHFLWDMVYIFGASMPWFCGAGANIWEKIGSSGFILISGISWRISRRTERKIKNGLLLIACGAVITLATMFMQPENMIKYGILTFMGSCMILLVPLDKLLAKVPPLIGAAVSLLLFAVFYDINLGSILIGFIDLPEILYHGEIMAYIGFMPRDFYSADYFGILPWIFMYLCGYFLSPLVTSASKKTLSYKIEPLAFMGRHSLVVYLLHQPVVYALAYIINKI